MFKFVQDKTLSDNNYKMKITALLAGFILIVGGYSLRCYSECGKGEGNDQKNHIKCDSSTESYCSIGEVCGHAEYTFYVSGEKFKATGNACADDTKSASSYCDAIKGHLNSISYSQVTNFDCDFKFCYTDLCNSGFTARISVLMSAAVLVYRLF